MYPISMYPNLVIPLMFHSKLDYQNLFYVPRQLNVYRLS